jgi:hypothetical protein
MTASLMTTAFLMPAALMPGSPATSASSTSMSDYFLQINGHHRFMIGYYLLHHVNESTRYKYSAIL